MDLRQIEQFVAVYEEGSFSKAARRESCTQPGLSMQIRALEQELGVQLFTRQPRGVEPTVAGKRLYTRSLGILNSIEDTERQIRGLSGEVSGTINGGMVPSVSRSALPAALSRYTEQYPNVEIRLDEAYGGALTERLIGGELDFAIVTGPPDAEGLHAERLAEHPMVLVSGPQAEWRHLTPLRLRDLPPLRMVLPTRRNSIRRLMDGFINSGDIPIATVIESDGLNATLEYVGRSNWSTITSVSSVIGAFEEGREDNRLVVNPIVRPQMTVAYFLIHRLRRPLSPAAELFVDLLRVELAEISGYWRRIVRGEA